MAANMNERIVILEAHADYVRRDIADLKLDVGAIRTDLGKLKDEVTDVKINLATLTERVNHLPSKGYIVTTSLGIIGAIGAMIAFQDHIRAWFNP